MIDARDFANKRSDDVEALALEFGAMKVNLVPPDSDVEEGVWCVPLTIGDKIKLNDDSSVGDKVRVYLKNNPLGWLGRVYGSEVIATTRGTQRAYALPEDQKPLDGGTRLMSRGIKELGWFA